MGGDYLELGSQIVLPLVLRLDLSLTYFEMSYKNIPQKFCGKYYRDFFHFIYHQVFFFLIISVGSSLCIGLLALNSSRSAFN